MCNDKGMGRSELVEIKNELRKILVEKELTPNTAEIVADMLRDDITATIENQTQDYINKGKFC